MSESLEKLRNRILADARIKAEEIIKEANEKADRIRAGAREKVQREAQEIISRTEVEAEAARRSIISSRTRANRLKLLDERNKIVQSVMNDVRESLSTIATTRDFQDTVKRLATEAVDAVGSGHPIVRVGFPKTSSNIGLGMLDDALPKGATVKYDEKLAEQDLGGVVVSDPEGKVVYRNTFRARLDHLDRELLTLISTAIFGEQRPNQQERVATAE